MPGIYKMDVGDDVEDAFRLKDLWQSSTFTIEPLPSLDAVHLELALPDAPKGIFDTSIYNFDQNKSLLYEINVYGTDNAENDSAKLPDDIAEPTPDDGKSDDADSSLDGQDSPWALDSLLEFLNETPTKDGPKLQSWDGFLDRHYKEPASAYLSEFGNKGFDAALSHRATISGLENSGRIIRSSVFLDSFIRLGLGWNSMLFHYNEQKRTFEKSLRDIRITGISLTALDGMINDVSRCGTNVQRIRRFVRANSLVPEQPSALSSLASAASVLLYSLEKQLSGHLRVNVSLIQVYNLFQKCGDLVNTLSEIISAAERARSESEVISILLSKCEDHEQRVPWLANTLHEIIHRCTKPWLTLVESWIGLKSERPLVTEGHTMRNSFVELEYPQTKTDTVLKSEYIYRPEFMPSSLPAEQARLLFETGKALRLLKRNQPDHPISRLDVVEASQAPPLTCAFSWGHIEQLQRRAIEYESRLRREIARYNSGDTSRSRPGTQHGAAEHDDKKELYGTDIAENFELIDLDNRQHVTGLLADNSYMESDKLYQDTEEKKFFSPQSLVHHDTAFGPPLGSVLYLSLGPTLAVQAKLVDFSCLHLLFKKYKLRYHLKLQWRFQLLSDGAFASRLSHSLFDPEMTSGERKSGVARGGFHTGLRLGNRDTWPPASSELRLVLMGLLSECYDAATESEPALLSTQPDAAKAKTLPGNLSFAIRDLTGDELIKCKDPNSIQALDFLRMQYKPSTTIESVITSQSLHKYDMLFKYLLRLSRMVSVVNSLVRDSTSRGSLSGDTHNIFQKFRIESHHFITTLNDYVFQVAIGTNWQRFEDTLTEIETCIDNDDVDGTIEIAGSLHRLRKYHEDVLDQILFSLFLEDEIRRRRGLEQVNKLLEEVFGTILAFMPLSRLDGASGIRNENEKTVYRLHVTFRKQVGTFVRFLRSLDGKRALSKARIAQLDGANNMSAKGTSSIFEYLLVRLDMKQYY